MTASIWVSDSYGRHIILKYAKDRSKDILKFTLVNSEFKHKLTHFFALKWRRVCRVSLEQNKIFLTADTICCLNKTVTPRGVSIFPSC